MTAVVRRIGLVGFDGKEDSQVWEDFKAGDDKALVYIFKQYYQVLFKYGIKVCQNKDLIKDCIQDIFTELWDNRENVKPVQYIRAYLLKFFRRQLLSKLLLEKKNTDLELQEVSAFGVEISFESVLIKEQISSETRDRVVRACQQLSKRQQEVIYLRFYNDLTYEQIADIMDLRYQSVRNLLHEAMKVLRKDSTLSLPLLLFLLVNLA
ncbi:sigma-70 family RNA polymerase sigma factor [soil metagenome]